MDIPGNDLADAKAKCREVCRLATIHDVSLVCEDSD
jgi:hypothetical protein